MICAPSLRFCSFFDLEVAELPLLRTFAALPCFVTTRRTKRCFPTRYKVYLSESHGELRALKPGLA